MDVIIPGGNIVEGEWRVGRRGEEGMMEKGQG